MSAATERMSRVDTAWLRMDGEANRMMIVGVLLLEPGIALDALRQRIAQRLLRWRRFRQRVVHDAVGALWADDEDFDLDRHVDRVDLPPLSGATERQRLQHLCGLLAAIPLDDRHPLWQMQLVERLGPGSAVIVRVHHCIGDGLALVAVLQSLTDGAPEPPWPAESPPRDEGDWLTEAVVRPLADIALKAMGKVGDRQVDRPADRRAAAPGEPRPGGGQPVRDGARQALHLAQDVAALALMPDDDATRLKGRPGGVKHVAWSDPLPLDEVKAVGQALRCSVNDVLLASVAGAIGQWLQQQGDDTRGRLIRAMVPVNLRPPEQVWQLGNRFGLAPLVLPIGIDNPVERVFEIRRRMDELKHSAQPLLAYAVLSVSGLFVKPVQDSLLGLFARKATAVMTNVPGPREPLSLCGSTIRQTLFWVPASGDIGVGVSILSYAGGVQFGLMTDDHLCREPQEIVDRFAPAFEALLLTTLMLPWPP